MADEFTEVTTQGWGSRIMSSIKGIIFGFLLTVAAICLLWWNEGRAVKTAKSLSEGEGAVVSVAADAVNPANEGKLIHVSGAATTGETLADADFGVSANAVRLRRAVLMFQWEEKQDSHTTHNVGGSTTTTTTYSYSKDWSSDLKPSSSFKHPEDHANPGAMRFEGRTLDAQNVTLGAFKLTPDLVQSINDFHPLAVTPENLARASEPLRKELKPAASGYYLGADPANPAVGDLKISFLAVAPQEVSIISGQTGGAFQPYMTKVGKPLQMLKVGRSSAAEMFQQAESSNATLTWVLRGVGFVVMWIGFALFFGPLVVLADFLPFLGSLVGAGTGLIAGVAAFGISLVVIAAAWIFYRPVVGIILLLLAAAATYGAITWLKKRKKAARPVASAGR